MRCSPASKIALAAELPVIDLSVDAGDGAGVSWLHRNAEVLSKTLRGGRYLMTVRTDDSRRDIILRRFGQRRTSTKTRIKPDKCVHLTARTAQRRHAADRTDVGCYNHTANMSLVREE